MGVLEMGGYQILLGFALSVRRGHRGLGVTSAVARRDLGLISVVLDSLHLCFDKSSSSKHGSRRRSSRRSDAARSYGSEPNSPLVAVVVDILDILTSATPDLQEGAARDPDTAAVCDAGVAAAIRVLAVLGVQPPEPLECHSATAVSLAIARLLQAQPPSIRLLEALRKLVTKPSHVTSWLASFGVPNPNHALFQALLEEDVPRLCIDGALTLLPTNRFCDARAEQDTQAETLCADVRSQALCAARMCVVSEHLEAIITKVCGAEAPSQLEEWRSVKDQGPSRDCVSDSRGSRPLMQNLLHLRRAIRQSCFSPMWRP